MSLYAALIATLVFTVLTTGVPLALTPYLMRRGECFAVSIPTHAQRDPRIRALRRRYLVIMLAVTVLGGGALALGGALLGQGLAGGGIHGDGVHSGDVRLPGGTDGGLTALTLIAFLAPVITSFALMLRYRRRVASLKGREGWQAERDTAAALVAEADLPCAIPLAWNLLYLPVILATLALGLALYPSMPDLIPMHANLVGTVDRYAPKTPESAIGLPLAIEVFMAACLACGHWAILRSKRPVDPTAPASSALAYGLFARAQSVFLLVSGVFTDAVIGVLFMLSASGILGLGQAGVIIAVSCVPVTLGAVALALVYGQAGARVFGRTQDETPLLMDDDRHWKLGILYFNPNDASLFLPRRFGIGWTMNLARPAAWVIIIGVGMASALFVALMMTLA